MPQSEKNSREYPELLNADGTPNLAKYWEKWGPDGFKHFVNTTGVDPASDEGQSAFDFFEKLKSQAASQKSVDAPGGSTLGNITNFFLGAAAAGKPSITRPSLAGAAVGVLPNILSGLSNIANLDGRVASPENAGNLASLAGTEAIRRGFVSPTNKKIGAALGALPGVVTSLAGGMGGQSVGEKLAEIFLRAAPGAAAGAGGSYLTQHLLDAPTIKADKYAGDIRKEFKPEVLVGDSPQNRDIASRVNSEEQIRLRLEQQKEEMDSHSKGYETFLKTVSQEKTTAEKALAAEATAQEKALTARQAMEDKALAAAKSAREKALAAERDTHKKELADAWNEQNKALAAAGAAHDKTKASLESAIRGLQEQREELASRRVPYSDDNAERTRQDKIAHIDKLLAIRREEARLADEAGQKKIGELEESSLKRIERLEGDQNKRMEALEKTWQEKIEAQEKARQQALAGQKEVGRKKLAEKEAIVKTLTGRISHTESHLAETRERTKLFGKSLEDTFPKDAPIGDDPATQRTWVTRQIAARQKDFGKEAPTAFAASLIDEAVNSAGSAEASLLIKRKLHAAAADPNMADIIRNKMLKQSLALVGAEDPNRTQASGKKLSAAIGAMDDVTKAHLFGTVEHARKVQAVVNMFENFRDHNMDIHANIGAKFLPRWVFHLRSPLQAIADRTYRPRNYENPKTIHNEPSRVVGDYLYKIATNPGLNQAPTRAALAVNRLIEAFYPAGGDDPEPPPPPQPKATPKYE